MLFLNLSALLTLVAITAPVFIHLLVHRRAERLVFPSLRFIQPSRLASMRRRMLDDVPLLIVRIAVLVAAIAALAAPLVVTPARQREWNARVVTETVTGPDLRDGVRRAIAALEQAPPARREIVVRSPLALGSIDAADVAAVPSSIGLRFERTGALPQTRTVAGAPVLAGGAVLLSRELTLAGARTSVRETRIAARAAWPIAVDAPADAQPTIDAAIAAVLAQRVWSPPVDRRARLIVGNRGPVDDVRAARQVTTPWMAEAVARIARDSELQTAASRTTAAPLDARFTAPPWHVVAVSGVGAELAPPSRLAPPAPLIAAAGSASELRIVSAASAFDLVTPLLMRSIVNSLSVVPDLREAEVVAIPDAQLRAWSRQAPPPGAPRLDTVDVDDRRWFWAAALGLLALEAWMRRARATEIDAREKGTGDSMEPFNNVA
jgi:hypothetical protein